MMHFFISSLMHILICFSALLLFSTILLTALICECCISIPFILCQSDSSFCWVAYREVFFLFREVGSGINVFTSEIASKFFGIVARSIQRKIFLRELSTNGKCLSRSQCDCRNCQICCWIFLCFICYLLMDFIKVIFYCTVICLYRVELRHIFDAFCYIAALLNKFRGACLPWFPLPPIIPWVLWWMEFCRPHFLWYPAVKCLMLLKDL